MTTERRDRVLATTSDIVELGTAFMRDAVLCVVPYLPRSRQDTTNSFEEHYYSKKFIRALADEIEANEPVCDHSVGICACGEQQILARLKLALRDRQPCSTCHGEGYLDVGVDDGSPLDSHDFRTCLTCKGEGSVPVDEGEPIPGRPGWRRLANGRELYSAAWLDPPLAS